MRAKYCIVIWLLAFGVLLNYALRYYTTASDSGMEYQLYLSILANGWHPLNNSMLNSSLVTTLFPALITQILNTDPLMTYKLYAVFLLPFLPVVALLFTSQFKGNYAGFLISIYLILGYIFLRGTMYIRTGMACIFFTLILIFIYQSSKWEYIVLVGAPLLVVASHYSVAYVTALLLTALVIINYLVNRRLLVKGIVALSALVMGIVIWYGLVTVTPMRYVETVVKEVVEAPTGTPGGMHTLTADGKPKPIEQPVFFSLDKREPVVQVAFGRNFRDMPPAKKLEWLIQWLAIVVLTGGLLISISRRVVWEMQVLAFLAVALTVILPYASVGYGVGRMYFQMTPILGICFITGANYLENLLDLRRNVLSTIVVVMCGLTILGLFSGQPFYTLI